MSTNIEWTDKTWNPIVGCSKVSPACDNCYAEKMAGRLAQIATAPAQYKGVVIPPLPGKPGWTWNGKTDLVDSALQKPLRWRKPCRVFVGSMTDLFKFQTPFEWVYSVFRIMERTPHITYQVLTKRPQHMKEFVEGYDFTLPNVWLGVTVENQEQADKRIPILLDTPAAVRFVSVEPMLGPINLARYLSFEWDCSCGWAGLNTDISCPKCYAHGEWGPIDEQERAQCPDCNHIFYPDWDQNVCPECGETSVCGACEDERPWWPEALDWVICGGETGPGARAAKADWFLDLKTECVDSLTPFFFKHWGTPYAPKKRGSGGRVLDGEHWEQFPTGNGG